MGEEPKAIEVPVKDSKELVAKLYEIAINYRDSFNGMASVGSRAGAEIFVAVQDKGQRQRYLFTNPNPDSMRSLWLSLRDGGYLQGVIILHEKIIQDENDRRQREKTEKSKERREWRWRWTSLLLPCGVAIAAAVISVMLADYYSSRSLSHRVNELEKDVAALKVATQAAPIADAGPASRPASRP